MTKDQEQSLRKHLVDLLAGGGAHAKFEDVIKGLPAKLRGIKPAKFPHSPWMLLEHLRLAQWDILEFSRHAKHVSPKWPRDIGRSRRLRRMRRRGTRASSNFDGI